VKLEVSDGRNNSITVTRRVKVTQIDAKGKLKMESLDATMNVRDKNNVSSEINPKCMDLKVCWQNVLRVCY